MNLKLECNYYIYRESIGLVNNIQVFETKYYNI